MTDDLFNVSRPSGSRWYSSWSMLCSVFAVKLPVTGTMRHQWLVLGQPFGQKSCCTSVFNLQLTIIQLWEHNNCVSDTEMTGDNTKRSEWLKWHSVSEVHDSKSQRDSQGYNSHLSEWIAQCRQVAIPILCEIATSWHTIRPIDNAASIRGSVALQNCLLIFPTSHVM